MTLTTLGRAAAVLATAPVYGLCRVAGLLWKACRIVGAVARQGFEDGSR